MATHCFSKWQRSGFTVTHSLHSGGRLKPTSGNHCTSSTRLRFCRLLSWTSGSLPDTMRTSAGAACVILRHSKLWQELRSLKSLSSQSCDSQNSVSSKNLSLGRRPNTGGQGAALAHIVRASRFLAPRSNVCFHCRKRHASPLGKSHSTTVMATSCRVQAAQISKHTC